MSKFDYTYNPVGTIATWTQQADSNAAVVNTLTYDAADQLIKNAQSGGATSYDHYHYDPAGNRLSEATNTSGSWVTTASQFNNLNQLTALGNSTSGSTASQTVAGNTSAPVNSATVNAVPATISNTTNFTATVPLPSGTNVVSVVAQPASGPTTTQRFQVVTTGAAASSLSYDLNGNCTQDENGNTYQWDALNRLTKITYPGGTYYTTFAYDGLSRRVQIVDNLSSGTTTKNYLWLGQEIAEERDANNNVTKRFFPQGEQQSGTSYYYTFDHVGSVREMLNSSGTIVARYSYDPYGRVTLVSGSNLATKQYARMYTHLPSGLNLTKYRAYDSNTGDWISRDPLGEREGTNLYSYVSDDPIDGRDPLGLAKRACTIEIVAGHFSNTAEPAGGAFEDLEKKEGKSGKMHLPDGDCVGYVSCGANSLNKQVPPPYQIPGMPQNTYNPQSWNPWSPNPDLLPFDDAHTHILEAILAALRLVPNRCNGDCCSVTIVVRCLGADMTKHGGNLCGWTVTIPCPNKAK